LSFWLGAVRESPETRRTGLRSIYLSTPLVLFVALAPFSDLFAQLSNLEERLKVRIPGLFLYLIFAPVVTLALVVLLWERRSLSSFGLRTPLFLDIPLGFLFFLMIVVVNDASASLLKFQPAQSQAVLTLNRYPLWWLTGWAIGAAALEELCFRGYATERVREISGSTFVGALCGLALDLYAHLLNRGSISNVAPMVCAQMLLTALYLWRRNVLPGFVAHVFWDAPQSPHIVAAIYTLPRLQAWLAFEHSWR
jgi:membrane protease YdiL (CAAX protease family)